MFHQMLLILIKLIWPGFFNKSSQYSFSKNKKNKKIFVTNLSKVCSFLETLRWPLIDLLLTVYLSQFSLTLYIFLFSSLFLALTHVVLADCTVLSLTRYPQSHSLGLLFTLLFFFPHTSHQLTINASKQALTFVHDIR